MVYTYVKGSKPQISTNKFVHIICPESVTFRVDVNILYFRFCRIYTNIHTVINKLIWLFWRKNFILV